MRSDEEFFSGLHIVDADTILTQVADFEWSVCRLCDNRQGNR